MLFRHRAGHKHRSANFGNRGRKGALRLESLESRRMMASDVILDWNEVIGQAIQADTTKPGPTWSSRNYAVVHAAMYDAVNGIVGGYSPYLYTTPGPQGASPEAAAAAAAHLSLTALYPQQAERFSQALVESLAKIPDGFAEAAGIGYGQTVAAAILAARADDHSADIVDYTVTDEPGHWQPEPGSSQTALGPGWGLVTPFGVNAVADFAIPPPPALDSAEYAAAFEEAKAYGAADSTVRTAEQTEIGNFWAYDRGGLGPPPILYNDIARQISDQLHNSMVENARLFALMNIAQADAGIACWDGKYIHDFWRPVTAIREADTDGNPFTEADPDWEPLGVPLGSFKTPPFPAYASGHATFGASVFKMMERFYGTDDVSFSMIGSAELPGVTRDFTSFSQASEENGQSRIYLGIHWSFDKTAGIQCGNEIADYVFENLLRPVERPTTIGLFASGPSTFKLRNSNSAGPADITFDYGAPAAGWQELVGDWNGDGIDTAGMYNFVTGTFYLKNDNTPGPADIVFDFGPRSFARAIAGDWDGDGIDTVGLYIPASNTFYLQNSFEPGEADISFTFGGGVGPSDPLALRLPQTLWQPLAGDWDGDGIDTVALYVPIGNPEGGTFFIRNEHESGVADKIVGYGPIDRYLLGLSGDWDGDGLDTFGLFDQVSNEFFLRNSNTPGAADLRFQYGPLNSGWKPIAGVWTNSDVQGLRLVGPLSNDSDAASVMADELNRLRDEAISRWIAAGASADQINALRAVETQIADLPGRLLGQWQNGVAYIDINAAGHGWFIDDSPTDDVEFEADGQRLRAIDDALASGGVDLLSVVAHELAHALGIDDISTSLDSADLNASTIAAATRRLPTAELLALLPD